MVFMLSGILAFAQNRVVTGKVTDEQGNGVPFASVKVRGSNNGVSADANGIYTIKAKQGDVLVVSATSMKTTDFTVGTQDFMTLALARGNVSEIQEVVVTGAFNTKRTKRSVGYNAQVVTGDQLNVARATNINNALAGKVAGAQILSQSGVALGRETNVRLRGANNLTSGLSNPIYVVDGTIVPSSNDINTDDIEDVTVSQGPAATALFGPEGVNGAIIITTKKGKRGKGIGVDINSGVQFDKVYIVPEYQNAYAGGASQDLLQYKWENGQPVEWKALDGKYYHDYSDDASWGPRIAGQEYIPWYAWYPGSKYSYQTAKLTPQPNNVKDFFNTGVTWNNNVAFGKSADNYNYRFSYGNLDQKGLIPGEYLKKNTLNLSTSLDLNNHFTVGANINYIAQDRSGENNDAYSNNSSGSFNQWFHRDLDMGIMKELRDLRSPTGILGSWNHNNPGSYDPTNPVKFYGGNYWFNFFSYFDNINNLERRDRLYGDVSLTYKYNNDLRIRGTYRKQQLTTNNEGIYKSILEYSSTQATYNPYGTTANADRNKSAYGTLNTFSNRESFELVPSYSTKINADFNVDASAGLVITKTNFRGINANTVGGLNVSDLYSLANSKSNINYGNTRQQSTSRAMFATLGVGYKNMVFVDGTFRRDYSSTEPSPINTKSIGASFVFSDLTKNATPWLSYGKLRASTGQTLNTLGIYALGTYYAIGTQQFSGNFLMTTPDRLVDQSLHGAVNTEKEIGVDLRFIKNRLGLSFTYWDRTNKNIPIDVSISGASGYTSKATNAGEIAKQGIELSFNARPIAMKNLEWNFNISYGKLIKNEVVKIAPGIERLVISSGAFSGTYGAYTVNAVGKPWGQMFGGGIKKINGVPVLDANGLFIREADQYFGNVLPDYTGGIQNTINFLKNFTLNVNIDYSHGGKFYSLSDFWGTFSGLTARTAVLNDRGLSVRDPVADGGGVHVIGVDADGKAFDKYVEGQTYFHQFQNSQISETNIYDLTFVKMRELSLGARIPIEKYRIGKFVKSANFSLVARNPWLIYSKTRDFDPSEIGNVYGEEGQFPGTRSLGFNLKIGF